MCGMRNLVGANNRKWIPFGIAPSGNEYRPVDFTFLTDWYLWAFPFVFSFSIFFRVSSRLGLRTGSPSFSLFPFC